MTSTSTPNCSHSRYFRPRAHAYKRALSECGTGDPAAAIFMSAFAGGNGSCDNTIVENAVLQHPQVGIAMQSTTYVEFRGPLGACDRNDIVRSSAMVATLSWQRISMMRPPRAQLSTINNDKSGRNRCATGSQTAARGGAVRLGLGGIVTS